MESECSCDSVEDSEYQSQIMSASRTLSSLPSGINEKLQKQLKGACSKGDLALTEQLLRNGADPSYFSTNGTHRPAVYYACNYGYYTLLRRLVEKHHCNVDYKTPSSGNSLLHLACLNGHENIAAYLTQCHQLDPLAQNKHGSTSLHLACVAGHATIVQFLIEDIHCDPRHFGNVNDTPFHMACRKGHLAIVQYLIAVHGCDPSQPTLVKGETALHLACLNGHMNIVRFLIVEQKCDTSAKDSLQNTPLHLAAQQGNTEIVRFLVQECQCDLTLCNHNNSAPLHLACKFGRTKVVRVLLEEGANPSIPGPENTMPIQLANNVEIVKLLIKYGATPTETDVKKVFPFMLDSPQGTIIRAMVVGDPESGKSILVETLKQPSVERKQSFFPILSPMQAKSIVSGFMQNEMNTDFLDFAGHTSYPVVISSFPVPIYFVVVDLSKDDEKIKFCLNFWIGLIEYNKPSFEFPQQLFIIGSHHDIFLKQDLRFRKRKLSVIKVFTESTIQKTSLQFQGFFPIDGRKAATQENLRKAMQKSHTSLQSYSSDVFSRALTIHIFSLFKDRLMCSVKELSMKIQKEDLPFPFSADKLCALCEHFESTANLMFLKNKASPEDSTIILDVKTLLSQVYNVLCSQSSSKNSSLYSQNGFTTSTQLGRLFPNLNPRVISCFMQCVSLCHQVEYSNQVFLQELTKEGDVPSVFKNGDGIVRKEEFVEEYLFCPCLLNLGHPDGMWQQSSNNCSYYTGWCLMCTEPYQQFPLQLLHDLLLQTAFKFAVSTSDPSERHTGLKHECNCDLWSKGIHWFNHDGIECYLELREDNQVLVIVMRCLEGSELRCIKLRSAIINHTLETVRQHSPLLKLQEGLLHPDQLQKHPLPSIKDRVVPFYRMNMVLKSLLESRVSTYDMKTSCQIRMKDLLFWDSYLHRGELYGMLNRPVNLDAEISEVFIFDFSQQFASDEEWKVLASTVFQIQPSSISIIQEQAQNKLTLIYQHILHCFKRQCQNPSYRELKTILEEYSLLKGRNL